MTWSAATIDSALARIRAGKSAISIAISTNDSSNTDNSSTEALAASGATGNDTARDISDARSDQEDLLDERRRLQAILDRGFLPFEDAQELRDRIAEIDIEIADLDVTIASDMEVIQTQYTTEIEATIADLNTQLGALPPYGVSTTTDSMRAAIESEIALREDLLAQGINEPNLQDRIVEMSNSDDAGIRNTVDRIREGDVEFYSFNEVEVPLSVALAEDPNFDPSTHTAIYRDPPDNTSILFAPNSAGGYHVGDGVILIKNNQGEIVIVHEVNHALNSSNNAGGVPEGATADQTSSIQSFTTELRAYSVDNRFADEAADTVTNLEGLASGTDPEATILADFGYDPATATGAEAFLVTEIQDFADTLPTDLNTITPAQQAQLESFYVADLVLNHDTLYQGFQEDYINDPVVRDAINDLILNGPNGNILNSDPINLNEIIQDIFDNLFN